jgi:tetratricopeptide (TPR) repeat protein
MDSEPLVRQTAIQDLARLHPQVSVGLITPLLYDPVKAVRLQAAMTMTALPRDQLDHRQIKAFEAALKEYQEAMAHVGDFPSGQFNLGNMHMNMGDLESAKKHYQAATQIDRLFYPAKINLAMLYNGMGRQEESERLFREIVKDHPELYEAAYSLGLLLVEREKYPDAVEFLRRASEGMPNRARIHYNLGLLLQQLEKDTEAESALARAYELNPNHFDYLYALTDFYLKRNQLKKAQYYAEQLASKHSDQPISHELLSYIEKNL